MLWTKATTKKAKQNKQISVQFFRFLRALMEVDPIPHVIFETTGSEFIQILHYFPVSLKITPPYFFYLKPWTKRAHQSETFGLKIHQNSHVIFETTFHIFL